MNASRWIGLLLVVSVLVLAGSPSRAAAATVPGAPTGVTAIAGDGEATVTWAAPATDGGSPITTYVVTAVEDPARTARVANVLTARVTGLTNGTSYSFTVKAGNAVGSSAPSTPSNSATPAEATIVLAAVTWSGVQQFQNLTIKRSGVVMHRAGDASLEIRVAGTLRIETGGSIEVSFKGCGPGTRWGAGECTGIDASANAAGGSYGGAGGGQGGTPNGLYGDPANPAELGSGGARIRQMASGAGGGRVRLVAGSLVLDGAIRADGGSERGGAGSGGAIQIEATVFSGAKTGSVEARGGASTGGNGGGGGGRVAICAGLQAFAGTISAAGGSGGTPGAAGTTKLCSHDATPPSTSAIASPRVNRNGWNNSDVTVTLRATDVTGESGVKEIGYSLSGAQTGETAVAGNVAVVTISAEGSTSLSYFARDNAGNQEPGKTLTVQIDRTPPTIVGTRNPAPNANGWTRSDVSVSFTCSDDLSGVGSCVGSTVVTEGVNQKVTGTATDQAGNKAVATVDGISIDRTGPTIADFEPAGGLLEGEPLAEVSAVVGDARSGIQPAGIVIRLNGEPVIPELTPLESGPIETIFSAAITATLRQPLGDGQHTIELIVPDRAGNVTRLARPIAVVGVGPNPHRASPVTTVARPSRSSDTQASPAAGDAEGPLVAGTQPALAAGSPSSSIAVAPAPATEPNAVSPALAEAVATAVRGIDDLPPALVTRARERAGQGDLRALMDQADRSSNALAGIGVDLSSTRYLLDRPTIAGSRVPGANAEGWNNTGVTVSFTCGESQSGLATCSVATVLSTEGADQAVTGTTTDPLGSSASATVGGINIDRTSPTTLATVDRPADTNGWHRAAVEVTLSASDALVGLAGINFGVDDGPVQTYATPFQVTGDGTHVVRYYATDRAGNVEAEQGLTLQIDAAPPTTTASVSPASDEAGLNSTDVDVTLAATDALAGVDRTEYNLDGTGWQQHRGPIAIGAEGAHTIQYRSLDRAGNLEATRILTVQMYRILRMMLE